MIVQEMFASIAEAVAYYHNKGYTTTNYTDQSRSMEKRQPFSRTIEGKVFINRIGFLEVIAEEYTDDSVETFCGVKNETV